jgi:hypothetical protein
VSEHPVLANDAVPDGAVPLVGYREWSIRTEDHARPRLLSLFHPATWPHDGPISAICMRPVTWPYPPVQPMHGTVPDESCQCGIYAFRRPVFESLNGASGPKVRGVVLGWGRYILGSLGWRAQFARLIALLQHEENPAIVDDLADRYDVTVLQDLERVHLVADATAA